MPTSIGPSPSPSNCERILDRLGGAAAAPASLQRLPLVVPDPAPVTLNDRLEGAIDSWSRAAENDLARAIPDLRGVRLLGNQGVRLYAVTHLLLTVPEPSQAALDGSVTTVLADAAQAFQVADPLWADFTTFARPTLENTSASRQLFRVLDEVTASYENPSVTAST